jgi:hypothetical protein
MHTNRTPRLTLMLAVVVGLVAFGLARSAPAATQDTASLNTDADTAAKIDNAMSAAPTSISAEATILDNELDANGKFVVLHEGTNGWYCSPDPLSTPTNDPWCYDQAWLDWAYAQLAGEDPPTTVVGMAYMLQGGSDASNTDPFATEPAEGEEWMISPPHVMFIQPEPFDMTVYTTDDTTGGPFVMWAGTSYEHIMMPVADHEHME